MSRAKSDIFTIGIILTTFAVLLLAFFTVPIRSRNVLSVSFVNYTNNIADGEQALFTITNTCDFEIFFLPLQPQTKNKDVWTPIKYRYGESMIKLSPHSEYKFVSACPTNGETWRVPVDWSYSKLDPIEDFRGHLEQNLILNWFLIRKGLWPKYFDRSAGIMGNSFIAFSETITNK